MKVRIRPARRIQRSDGYRACSVCRKRECRRSRPLCRAMRLLKPNQRPCQCAGGCHHTHRTGGHPLCVFHPNHTELAWAELERPIRRAG